MDEIATHFMKKFFNNLLRLIRPLSDDTEMERYEDR
jgi:hypothetical protein